MNSFRLFRGSAGRWFPLALLCITILALFHRLLLGEVLFWGLPSLQFYPWRDFAMSELAQGRLPLWNPYNGAGAPLLANYQSALLYPPHALYWLRSGPQMMGILGMLHVAWAGFGMWLFTGRLKLPALGRGIAVLAYPLSNTLLARFGTFPMPDVAAWLPWLLLATDALIDGVTLFRALALAGVLAMQLLAGHAQWTLYSLVLAGCYGLWRMAGERGQRRAGQIAAGVVLAGVLGTGIAAAQLLPTAELQPESQRASGVDEDFALNFSYAPLSLLTLFNPNFFGNPGDGSYVIGGAYFETAAYVGILPVMLAILGTVAYFRMRKKWTPASTDHLIPFFALVAVVAVALAFGKFTPLYPLLYRYMPTFKLFQAPARWLLLTVFSLAMLSALAVPHWKATPKTRQRAILLLTVAFSITLAGFGAQWLMPGAPALTVQLMRGFATLGILLLAAAVIFITQPRGEQSGARWAIGVLVFVAVDLWWANALSNPTVPAQFYERQNPVTASRVFWPDTANNALPDVAFDRYLSLKDYRVAVDRRAEYRQSMLPNLNLLDRQPSFNSFEPLRPDELERFSSLLNRTLRPALLNAAGVGKVYESAMEGVDAPRVWMVTSALSAETADAAEQLIGADDWDPYRTVVVEGKIDVPNSQQAGTARITEENPLALTIQVDSPGGGALVVADVYYPGWQATVDDAEVPIYRANVAFRAVAVPAGQHTVRMVYAPRSFAIGVAVSAASLAIWGLLFVVALGQFTRSSRRSA